MFSEFVRERRRAHDNTGEDWSEKSQTIANVASLFLLPRASHEHLTMKILHIDRLKRGRETVEDQLRSPGKSHTCAYTCIVKCAQNLRCHKSPRTCFEGDCRNIARLSIRAHAHMYVHRYPRRSIWVVRIGRQDRLF